MVSTIRDARPRKNSVLAMFFTATWWAMPTMAPVAA